MIELKEQRCSRMRELIFIKEVITKYSDEIVDYLKAAKMAEKNHLNLTVEDMFLLREIQGKHLN